ncbi:MAG: bifunctional methylenetetrahydrofolate dehydrogenase/methenyltetrahydrofolate cyclohydrolase FolD [Ethanoligenens sp.]
MPAKLLDGKAASAKVRTQVAKEVRALQAHGISPSLAVVLVGDNPASQVYVRNKEKDCEEVGIRSVGCRLSTDTTQEELLTVVDRLNRDPMVHGILVQLPLPKQIDERAVIAAINPAKDVDAFHPSNVGRIMLDDYDFLPCTPAGIMELLADAGISPVGKECVIIGRSNIVGKPMAMLLLHANGTVTIAHSKTPNLAAVTARADILVSAVGRAGFVTADMVKPGAVVIDVGMNRLESGKLAGDVDFAAVAEKASYITPVPGGVGPMTRAMLLKNTVKAAALRPTNA